MKCGPGMLHEEKSGIICLKSLNLMNLYDIMQCSFNASFCNISFESTDWCTPAGLIVAQRLSS
jgi:hypothetical protein